MAGPERAPSLISGRDRSYPVAVSGIVRCALIVAWAGACGRVGYDPVDGDGGGGLTLRYPSDRVDAVVDQTTVALVPTVTGGDPSFTIAPALPLGLVLDPGSGIIAGVPMTTVDELPYTVTATTPRATATFTLVVTALPGSEVDVTADFPDDDGGADAVCFATPAGGCTLRAAVETANRRSGPQLIRLVAGTYALRDALEDVANDVALVGRGVGATTIQPTAPQPGYGLLRLAGPHRLRLREAAFRDFGPVDGAVVHVTAGTLDADGCAFADNASAGSGGVVFVAGGATARLTRSTFTGNQSYGGCCGGWGGVIDGEDPGTSILVAQCTATDNQSAWGSFAHITSGTTLRLENSTLYGNLATIAGTLATPGGVYTLHNVTIAHNRNTANDSAGIYLHSLPCHYTITNSIVAFNTDGTGAEHNCDRNDLGASITTGGGNLISDGASNCAAYFDAPTDRLAADPGLEPGPPADHGGRTATILPTPTSAAVDRGQGDLCPPIDQRGLPRPVARLSATPACDVGAVELQ